MDLVGSEWATMRFDANTSAALADAAEVLAFAIRNLKGKP